MSEASGQACPVCGVSSPPGMGFCGSCGSPLPAGCPQCGFENPPEFRFCGRCGATLEKAPEPPSESPATSRTELAERRQLTVLFIDLVGSTELSERLDPEELREVVLAYQSACGEVIDRFGGHIAQYLGDGLLVYFGHPRAHEDDARRAVEAGLELTAAVQALEVELPSHTEVGLSVRVGIHTGEVVLGEVGAGATRERLALGRTPNVAARLQGIAEPNRVVMSEATERLIQGFFDCRSLGARELKGVDEALEIHEAVRKSAVRSRFEAQATKGLTPAVGRRRELAMLEDRFEQVKQGRGQVVLVSGEAGIGKSRLVYLFQQGVASEVSRWLVCSGSSRYRNTAFRPVIELLLAVFQIADDEAPEEKIGKIERGLQPFGLDLAETVPVFARLLEVPLDGGYQAPDLSPQRWKIKTLDCVISLLLRSAADQPVVLVLEDLHWFDPSSLELLEMLAEEAASNPLLLLMTTRPGFQPGWKVTEIGVGRLEPEQVEELVTVLAGGKPLPPFLVEQIAQRTDGVPLFVEELTKTVLESGYLEETEDRFTVEAQLQSSSLSATTPPLAIPATLKDSLMERLDRLGEAKGVAQECAVLGRDFGYEQLQAVSLLADDALRRHLARLVDAELLFQEGVLPQARFAFKHALVQETAYESILRRERRELHQRVVGVLEEHFPEVSRNEPELLALHYEQAERLEEAIAHWKLAGERASSRWAHLEACRHFERALELLGRLPEAAGRLQRELELRLALGTGQIATRGYAAEEVKLTYGRAQELCEELGDTPLPVRHGIWAVHLMRGDLEVTGQLAAWYESFVDSAADQASLMMAHACLGTWTFCRGESAGAEEHLARTMDLWKAEEHEEAVRGYGGCGGFYGHLLTTWLLWLTGRPDRAWEHYLEILALAEKLPTPYTLATTLTFGIVLGQGRRETERAAEAADRVLDLSTRHDYPWLATVGQIGRGWATARAGDPDRGIRLLEQGLSTFKATGTLVYYPYYVSFLAETLLGADRAEEALDLLPEAIDLARRNVDIFYLPELLRLRGEALSRRSPEDAGAEPSLREAVELAAAHGAASLELRAATSRARLLRAGCDRQGARAALAGVYERFEEGLDTADLREAAELLAELAETADQPEPSR